MGQKDVLSYWDRIPPYAIVAAARLGKVPVELRADPAGSKDTVFRLSVASGQVVEGLVPILQHIGKNASAGCGLYGGSEEASQVEDWMAFCKVALSSGPGFDVGCASLSDALALRTFLVGHGVTIADLCVWGMIHSTPQWAKVHRQPGVVNLVRYFEFCNHQPVLKDVLAELDPKAVKLRSMGQDPEAERAKQGTTGSFDIELPGAKLGSVVTRFPPEPSGYLHIGHAKAALLNQHFADVYKGKLIVRFDDTNPTKESTEFVDNIIEDMKRLGLKFETLPSFTSFRVRRPSDIPPYIDQTALITHTSDYFEQMIDMATKLIASGELYADNTDVDKMREERLACIPSKCRDAPVEENQRAWKEMLAGSDEGQTYCLRVKMDMKAGNACLRDPVAYRCNAHPHWKTGTKYKAYPTYDFACPYVDAKQGVTHALRTSEYSEREEQFQRILKMMQKQDKKLPRVHIWDYSRLNFVHTVLSKRKLKHLVDTGVVDGWSDPRFPTIQGILRRGMTVEALKEFILLQGASKNTTLQEWDKIWTINKKVIDPISPRHTAVDVTGVVPVTLSNGPEQLVIATVPKHKKNADVGKKSLYKTRRIFIEQVDAAACSENEEVTLMDWGNCIMRKIHKDANGAVTAIDADCHLEGDFKKTKLKLTWLADVQDLVPLRLVHLEHLITKPKLEEEDEFEDFVNRDSWKEMHALGDPNMRTLQRDDIIQLERKGFFRVDQSMYRPGKDLVLIEIPDGRQKK